MPPQHTLISIVEIFYFLNFQSLLIFPVPLIHQPPIIVHVAIFMRLLCPLCLSVSVHGRPLANYTSLPLTVFYPQLVRQTFARALFLVVCLGKLSTVRPIMCPPIIDRSEHSTAALP